MSCDDKKNQIMQAVEKLLVSKRLHEITTDDVAQCAHVGKGTLYRYFNDKDDLLFETAVHGFSELCEILDQHADLSGDFHAQLSSVCDQILHFMGRRRQLFRALHSEEARAYWQRAEYRERWLASRQRLLSSLERILDAGVARGAIRRDIPAGALAAVLLGLVRMGARELRDGLPGMSGLGWLVDLFLHGASAANGAAAGTNQTAPQTTQAAPGQVGGDQG